MLGDLDAYGNLPDSAYAAHARTTLRSCLTLIKVTLQAMAVLTCSNAVRAQGLLEYNITRPLRVCTASSQNSGLRCNNGPPELSHAVQPHGPVPPGGWCAAGQDFCGNDIDLWSEVAGRLGLEEGRDFERVCFGESGFANLIAALAEENIDYGICDVGVSAITASSDREDRGIQFSRAVHHSALAVLVHAPLKQRGNWAFFEPLHLNVWIGIAVTVVVTPLIVFFFEAVFNKSPFFSDDGKLDILRGLRECIWHSVCHTLSIDVFKVKSFPARIVTVAYAFLVLILTHTYTANLAAFLTVQRLDLSIQSIGDLRGKAVATIGTYVDRLSINHQISASTVDAWDYDRMVAKLQAGEYAAIISDDTQLIPRAYSDDSCSLHILKQEVEKFDLAFAFSKSFPSDDFREDVSSALLEMQEDGTLSDIRAQYTPPKPACLSEATEFSETNQVEISALWGLWIIMAGATAASIAAGLVEWAIKRHRGHPDADIIGDRIGELGRLVSGARHNTARVQAADAAVEAVCGPTALHQPAPLRGSSTAPTADHMRVELGASPFIRPGPGPGPDPRRPLRHSSTHGRVHHLSARSHNSTISEECQLASPVAAPCNLSMHSVPSIGRASAVDSTSSNEGSGHGGSPDGAAIMLPKPPLALAEVGAAPQPQHVQHVQHGGAEAGQGGREFRSELSEVLSMLRMVTERVNTLQGAPRVHV